MGQGIEQPGDGGNSDMEALAHQLLETGCEMSALEAALIAGAMECSGNNVTQAAKLLGVSRATLDYRLKKKQG